MRKIVVLLAVMTENTNGIARRFMSSGVFLPSNLLNRNMYNNKKEGERKYCGNDLAKSNSAQRSQGASKTFFGSTCRLLRRTRNIDFVLLCRPRNIDLFAPQAGKIALL